MPSRASAGAALALRRRAGPALAGQLWRVSAAPYRAPVAAFRGRRGSSHTASTETRNGLAGDTVGVAQAMSFQLPGPDEVSDCGRAAAQGGGGGGGGHGCDFIHAEEIALGVGHER